jgi:hypothetical protein
LKQGKALITISVENTTEVTGTNEGCRDLDGSAHFMSRALVTLSASVACYKLCLFLSLVPVTVGNFKKIRSSVNPASLLCLCFL